MTEPINIRDGCRKSLPLHGSLSSSLEAVPVSAPIAISSSSRRRPTLSSETPDTYFTSIMESPSLSRSSRYQRYSMMEGSHEKFGDLQKPGKLGASVGTNHNTSSKKDTLLQRKDASKNVVKSNPKDKPQSTRPRASSSVSKTSIPLATCSTTIDDKHTKEISPRIPSVAPSIHPSIQKLGSLIRMGVINGSNGRCIAMLEAFKEIIRDYIVPSHSTIGRSLDSHLRPQINHLVRSRSLSVSMKNAIKNLKMEISNIPLEFDEHQGKEFLVCCIDTYIRERIQLADQLIGSQTLTKIRDSDVIMVYSRSSVVIEALKFAKKNNRSFRVVVVDSRPSFDGRYTAKALSEAGIPVTYILINSLGYVIKEITKIIIGAHCIFSNGTLLGKLGTSMVAMTGFDHHIPVIALCETYKFTDKVQLETAAFEETADPALLEVRSTGPLTPYLLNQKGQASLLFQPDSDISGSTKGKPKYLNVVHDITSSRYISVVITEIGLIPCTSIPVVLREYQSG